MAPMKDYLAMTLLTQDNSGDTGTSKRFYYLKEKVAAPRQGWGEREREREQQHGAKSCAFYCDRSCLLPWGRVRMFRNKAG